MQLQGYESSDVLGRLQQEFPLATWKCQQDPDNSSEWEIELSATTGVVIWQSKRLCWIADHRINATPVL